MQNPAIHALIFGTRDVVRTALEGKSALASPESTSGLLLRNKRTSWTQVIHEIEAESRCEESLTEALDALLRAREGSALLNSGLARWSRGASTGRGSSPF